MTFAGVAQAAGISRSWLYTQPDISSQIRSLRVKTDGAALDRNKHLADENARLRRQLARALGEQRSSRTRSGNDPGR